MSVRSFSKGSGSARSAHTATKPNEQEEYQIVSPLTILAALIGLVVGGAICFPAGFYYRKNVSEKEISSAEEEGKRIINEAIKSAETKKKEALLEAKEEILKNRSEYEKEVKERRAAGKPAAAKRREPRPQDRGHREEGRIPGTKACRH